MSKTSKSAAAAVATVVPPKRWFEQGLECHTEAHEYAHKVKIRALHAGWYFIQAKLGCAHGEFGALCAEHEQTLSARTIQSYMKFAEDVLVSVVAAQRQLTDKEVRELVLRNNQLTDVKLLEAGKDVVVHSTIGFVDLTRQLGMFRQFGTYDAVKHALEKTRGPKEAQQIEFDFTVARAGVKTLLAIATCAQDRLPPAEQMAELESQLVEALAAVRSRKGSVIDISARDSKTPAEGALPRAAATANNA